MSTALKIIELYADGPNLNEINKDFGIQIDGYTFNPSLFKKNGAKDYLNYCKQILEICPDKPISFEVFSDDENGMIRQAEILNNLGKNIYVKIPISYTNGDSTAKVIQNLVSQNIKLNITAIFLIEQIQQIIKIVENSEAILSIFAGRIYDCGIDAKKKLNEMNKYIKENSNCKSLWASTRMAYDYISAKEINTNIITMQTTHIEKLKMIGTDPKQYSLDTVRQFYKDAKSSNFKI